MARQAPELPNSYEDLISSYYAGPPRSRGVPETLEAILGANNIAHVVTLSVDDGEILPQSGAAHGPSEEYVVALPTAGGAAAPRSDPSTSAIAAAPAQTAQGPATATPLPATPPGTASAPPAHPPAPTTSTPVARAPGGQAQPAPAAAASPGAPAAPAPTTAAAPTALAQQPASRKPDEDELAADMKAILSGNSVYDPASGRTVARDQVTAAGSSSPTQPSGGLPVPDGNEHEIFDKIAESMQYAKAYDLGTIDLEDRLDDFDRLSDLREPGRGRGDAAPGGDRDDDVGAAPVGAGEFLEDVDAIRSAAEDRVHESLRNAAEAISGGFSHAACLPSALALASATAQAPEQRTDRAGVEVIAGGGLYEAPLLVGTPPGVAFAYEQVVALPDLYESVEQMMNANDAELGTLKTLIERTAAHSRDGSAAAVSDAEWQEATNGRYLELAEQNFSHFAPDVLLGDEIASRGAHHSNHKETWESHHRTALEEARSGSAEPTPRAMVVNAFGDHFLIDAFTPGYLINKDAVVNYFEHNFLAEHKLTAPASAFFDRVAEGAFVGDVEERFSGLKSAELAHSYAPLDTRIDSASRFAALLKLACEAQPDRMANLVVGALHDHLNASGVEVTNDAGDPPWQLTGESNLTPQTATIVKKALEASVANLRDARLRSADDATCFGRVWRFTPKLTAASRPTIVNLVHEFTNPASTRASDAAAAVITGNVDQLVHALVDQDQKPRAS